MMVRQMNAPNVAQNPTQLRQRSRMGVSYQTRGLPDYNKRFFLMSRQAETARRTREHGCVRL